VGEVDAPDISAWFSHMRTSPGGHGKPRSERTIQIYARSARAFFHWLMRQETIESNPFDRDPAMLAGTNTIHLCQERPSFLVLPVIHHEEIIG
jgi:site-specific recombinase XerD